MPTSHLPSGADGEADPRRASEVSRPQAQLHSGRNLADHRRLPGVEWIASDEEAPAWPQWLIDRADEVPGAAVHLLEEGEKRVPTAVRGTEALHHAEVDAIVRPVAHRLGSVAHEERGSVGPLRYRLPGDRGTRLARRLPVSQPDFQTGIGAVAKEVDGTLPAVVRSVSHRMTLTEWAVRG